MVQGRGADAESSGRPLRPTATEFVRVSPVPGLSRLLILPLGIASTVISSRAAGPSGFGSAARYMNWLRLNHLLVKVT